MTNYQEKSLERLKELSLLEDGWFDGEGIRINADILSLVEQYTQIFPIDFPIFIYPAENGGLSVEWDKEDYTFGAFFETNKIDCVISRTSDNLYTSGTFQYNEKNILEKVKDYFEKAAIYLEKNESDI